MGKTREKIPGAFFRCGIDQKQLQKPPKFTKTNGPGSPPPSRTKTVQNTPGPVVSSRGTVQDVGKTREKTTGAVLDSGNGKKRRRTPSRNADSLPGQEKRAVIPANPETATHNSQPQTPRVRHYGKLTCPPLPRTIEVHRRDTRPWVRFRHTCTNTEYTQIFDSRVIIIPT